MSFKNFSTEPNPLSLKLAQLRAQGKKILDLTVSNPTLCGFGYLRTDLLKPFRDPGNLIYEPEPHGLLEARRAICNYYRRHQSIELEENQIFITANTSEAYSFVFKLLTDPGDRILAPCPSYPLLDYLAGFHGLEMLRYFLNYHGRWKIGFEKISAQAQKARALLLVHPNNPTGSYISEEEKAAIQKISSGHGLPLIIDEVFLDYPASGGAPPKSFAVCNEAPAFILSGISKVLGLPQMKISWIIVNGPEDFKNQAIQKLEIISDTYLSAATPAQRALPAWFDSSEKIQKEIRQRLQTNRMTAQKEFRKTAGLKLLPPEGGWYALLEMPESKTDEEWTLFLLENARVLTHPGYLFDFNEERYLVLSLLAAPETFSEGVRRIAANI